MLIDSHCHLNYDDFKEDFDAVLHRADLMGVKHMLSVCTTLEEAPSIQNLVNTYPQLNCSVGVHPHHAAQSMKEGHLATALENLLKGPKVVALGETGLDYYYEHSPKDPQQEAFRIHIALAKKYDLPLIVHTRDAEEDTIKLLKQEKGSIRGVIHCFTGTQWLAEQALELGFYISISGIVTFKKADELRQIIQEIIPLDRLLIETDSPYLAPIPHRGKRNEPAFVIHVAETIAELKNVSMLELEQTISQNYFNLFGWKEAF